MRQTPLRPMSAVFASLLVTGVLALSACKGGQGDAAADAKDPKKKGPEAVPVEVAQASRRAVAASYTGTAPLEPRAEAQVIAKVSGVGRALAFRIKAALGDDALDPPAPEELDPAAPDEEGAQDPREAADTWSESS